MALQSGQSHGAFLTVGEAADLLGVSPWTIRKWDQSGKLTATRHPEDGRRIYRRDDVKAVLQSDHLSSPNGPRIAPRTDWTEMGNAEHFVQFYEDDAFLMTSVSGFIGTGLSAGDSGIVIATPEHCAGIRERLTKLGLDVAAAVERQQIIFLDAAQTLSQFMVDGSPDPRSFEKVIGGTLAQLAAGGRHVRAFGEMVALLWADGNQTAAVRLEELWNDLASAHCFALFCAYPMHAFGDGNHSERFRDICTCHSKVIPAESYASLAGTDDRLRAISRLQQKAQALEAEVARRIEIEKALLARERELTDFFENATEGLHRVAGDGTILWANKAEMNLLGYAPEEYIGHHIAEFHVDRAVIEDMLARLLNGEALHNAPSTMRHKDGSIKHVLVNSNGCFEEGRFLHTRCFTRDVTDRVMAQQLQEQLLKSERAARADAERTSRMKDEFLATLSHEVRTPLNAIYGWTKIIQQSPGDAQTVAEGIAVIDRNVIAQTQLIEDLLDMSRIISGKLRLEMQEVDLVQVIDAAIDTVRPLAHAKQIQLKTVLDPLAGPVAGDPSRLRQIVWNLLTNAIKFTPKDGKVEVLLERVNSHVEITVSDNGQGISPQFLPHVFERFRQADSSTTRKHGGLGIGLSIVRQLVELHSGQIHAKSPGEAQGASFVVAIPLVAAKTANKTNRTVTHESFSIDASPVTLTGINVLVVDDEPDACELVARLVRESGAQVITATSADHALELLESHDLHVLVSDIGMPGKDGYQLIRELRSSPVAKGKDIPALALTAFARSEDRRRAMLAGYQVHLAKPLEPQELVVTLASLVRRAAK